MRNPWIKNRCLQGTVPIGAKCLGIQTEPFLGPRLATVIPCYFKKGGKATCLTCAKPSKNYVVQRKFCFITKKTRLPDMRQKGRMRTTEAPRWNRFFQQLGTQKQPCNPWQKSPAPVQDDRSLFPASLEQEGSKRILDFFELMPCALEALTVIKTFCLWLAIPSCWRIGESKKLGVFKTTQTQNTTNQNPTKKPKQPKKTPRKLRETLRFQKVPKPLSTASRCHSKSHS